MRVWHLERKKKNRAEKRNLRGFEENKENEKNKKRKKNRGLRKWEVLERMAEKARRGERESRTGIRTCSCLRGEPVGIFVVFPLLASIYRSIFHPLLWFLDIVG